jgi:hypothetical protein
MLVLCGGFVAAVLFALDSKPTTHLMSPFAFRQYGRGLPPLLYSDRDEQSLPSPPLVEPFGAAQLHETQLSFDRLGNTIESANQKLKLDKDVLLVYLSAHWISFGGRVYLVDSSYNPQFGQPNNNDSCHELSEVLNVLNGSRARLTLVLLDAGRATWDPRWGQVVDLLPEQLTEAVKDLKRPAGGGDLWVLSAYSPHETAHLLHSARRSVFATFATAALNGAADRDGDWEVTFTEFHDFVRANVNRFVGSVPGELVSQTPLLLQAGVGRSDKLPEVTLTRPSKPWSVNDEYKAITGHELVDPAAEKKEADAKKKQVTRRRSEPAAKLAWSLLSGRGVLAQAAASAQPPAAANQKAETPSPPPAAASSPGEASKAATPNGAAAPAGAPPAEKTGEQPAGVPAAQSQTAPGPAAAPAAAPPPPPAKPELPPTKEPLEILWRECDKLAAREEGGWIAVDYAPHVWRELLVTLADWNWRETCGSLPDTKAYEERVRELRSALKQYQDRYSTDPDRRESLLQDSAQRRQVLQALRLRNDLILLAPYYVGWHDAESLFAESEIRGDLDLFLGELIALTDMLSADPSSQPSLQDRTAQVVSKVEELNKLRLRLDARLDATLQEATLKDRDSTVNAYAVRYLATTPLPYRGHDRRERLKAAIKELNQKEGERLNKHFRALASPSEQRTELTVEPRSSSPQLNNRLEFQVLLVRLAEGQSPRVELLEKLREQTRVGGSSSAIAQFSRELEGFYRGLPDTLMDGGGRSPAMAERRLRLIDPLYAVQSRLETQATRLVARLAYPEAFRDPGLALTMSPVTDFTVAAGRGGSTLRLQAGASGDLPAVVTLTLEFDPQLVSLEFDPKLIAGEPAPPAADSGQRDASAVQVTPGTGTLSLRFTVQDPDKLQPLPIRLSDRRDPATIVEGQQPKTALKLRLEADRPSQPEVKEISLRLPGPERWDLVALGTDQNWEPITSGPDQVGLILLPFPSGITPISLGVRNLASRERTVQAEIWIAPQRSRLEAKDRPSPLNAGALEAQGFVRLAVAPPVKAPPDSLSSAPTMLKLAPPPPPPPAEGKPPAAPPPQAAPADDKAPKPDPRPALDRDLLCVLKYDETAEIRWLELRPRHASEYLQPAVRYTKNGRRLDVTVFAKPEAQLRPEGCLVSFEVLGSFGGRPIAGRFDAQIQQGRSGRMDATLPTTDGPSEVELRLHADGYPRAFVYRFPTDQDIDGLLPLDVRNIEIVQPDAASAVYDPDKVSEFPIELRIEAPWLYVRQGASWVLEMLEPSNPGFVERLGQPRLLEFERAINCRWEQPAADGGLQIFTALGDFKLTERTGGYRNRRVRLIAALELTATGERKEDEIELVFDASAPRLAVPLSATVVQGGRLSIPVRADDEGLSGVARVEFAIDEQQVGEMKEPKPAVHNGGDEYEVSIPKVEQPPGQYQFLVRAVDRVGRTSSIEKIRVRVEPPPVVEPAAAAKATLRITLAEPASWANVKVDGEDKGRLRPGQPLVLSDLDPGKHKVEAKGFLRNKEASYSEEFELKPGEVKPVTLNLTQAPTVPPKQK